jgi:ABC-2 type transport system ATP-binding protein
MEGAMQKVTERPAEMTEALQVEEESPAINTLGLVKRYRSTTALDGLTMTVGRGEVFGFLGPNGAGKTTAVKLLVGLSKPTAGEGWVLGAPIGNREARKRIGYLPELFRYQDWLTAREVLAFHCRLAGIPGSERREQIEHALSIAGLEGRGDDRVGNYSKGMQQRLGLGVSMLGQPEVVFLDEPTSALDPVGRHDVREIIRRLKNRGTTVFLNSHLLSEVEQVCDRVAVVDHGRVIAMGTVDELRNTGKSVRLHVTGLDGSAVPELRRFGQIEVEGDWYTIRDLDHDGIPAVVTEVVRLGGRVYAVEPSGGTLEETFLQLVEGENHAGADDSRAHPS